METRKHLYKNKNNFSLTRVGIISDTHGFLDEKVFSYFENVDEIWHAGDFGSEVAEKLSAFKNLRGVFGNIDGKKVRDFFPLHNQFRVEELNVWMTHIGGFPPNYEPGILKKLQAHTPDIFVCGHSHILKVMRDKNLNNMLHINPGATGRSGFHIMRTIVRLEIDRKKIQNVEAIELGKRGE